MDITPLIPKGKQIITGYGDGKLRVNGIAHTCSVLVFPDKTMPWSAAPNAAISLESLAPVINAPRGEVELLVIGCGKNQSILPPKIKNALKDAGIALEVMDTGAACRTYNILIGEGRRVAAALVAI